MRILTTDTVTLADSATPRSILDRILKNRGIMDIETFLKVPAIESLSLSQFGYTKELSTVKKMLKPLLSGNQPIIVYTDYDADGLTGGSILWETLHLVGFHVIPYVPDRKTEGYGFSIAAIDQIQNEYNPALIISVDHGITAHEQISHAKKYGIPIIVTDHHTRQETLPEDASVIFHIPELSGSGVAYLFSKAIFEMFEDTIGATNPQKHAKLTQYMKTDYPGIAAIGTIADLVPLTGTSRAITKHGLASFPSIRRPGITELCRQAKLKTKSIETYHVGFAIAPRINAIGRLSHALDAIRLLCTTSTSRAGKLAERLGALNDERKGLVKQAVKEAKEQVNASITDGKLPSVIVTYHKDWHEGIIGLIASGLVEEYYRPVIVMTEGEHALKGSARSIAGVSIVKMLSSVSSHLITFGGHTMAAGFSIIADKRNEFTNDIIALADSVIKPEHFERAIEVDISIPLEIAGLELAQAIDSMAPFGPGNHKPVFHSVGCVHTKKQMGKDFSHLKLTIIPPSPESNHKHMLEVVAFGKGELYTSIETGTLYDFIYTLDLNTWNGNTMPQAKLIHHCPANML